MNKANEVSCVRHPDRKTTPESPDAGKWLTMKRFSREKDDFVVDHYCPDCCMQFENGKLV